MNHSLLNYGPDRIVDPLTPEQIYLINQYQMYIKDGIMEGKLTCRKRHDSPHGEEGGDMGVLIADAQGLACPYCDYRQSDFLSTPMSLPDPIYAAISVEEIDHFIEKAKDHQAQYQALLERMGESPLVAGLLINLQARIEELETRKAQVGLSI